VCAACGCDIEVDDFARAMFALELGQLSLFEESEEPEPPDDR
jgi:hypothetical protein